MKFARRKNVGLLSEEELANSAVHWVSIYSLLACIALLDLQAFLSGNPISLWQWGYCMGSLLIWAFGIYFALVKDSNLAFVPLNFFNLLFPFLISQKVNHPWTSYGLIAVIAMVYFTGVSNKWAWIALIGFPIVGQVLAAERSLNSISDANDLALFGSYFSTLWILIVAFFLRRVRKLFFDTTRLIDSQIETLAGDLDLRNQNIRRLNFRDHENLQLHGTILNTLLVIRNTPALLENPREAGRMLQADFHSLTSEEELKHLPLDQRISAEFNRFSHRRLNLEFKEFTEPLTVPRNKDILRECIREILLNLEKHTDATIAKITLLEESKGLFTLRIIENSLMQENGRGQGQLIDEALGSLSLKRLVSALEADWSVSPSELKGWIEHEIHFDSVPFKVDPLSKIKSLRNVSTQVMADNYLIMTIVYGALIFPALLWFNGFSISNFTILMALAIGALSIRIKELREILGAVSSLLSLLVLPVTLFATSTCSQIQTLPWVFNAILGTVFAGSIATASRLLKWLPGIGLLLESSSLGYFLPSGCSQLLIGSAPGVAMILISALIIGNLRNKNIQRDVRAALTIVDSRKSLRTAEMQLEIARDELFDQISGFINNLANALSDRRKVKDSIDSELLRLRTYLLCSEYFESDFIRELYRTLERKFQSGIDTRLQILGSGDFDLPREIFQETLQAISQSTSAFFEITILNIDEISLQIKVPESNVSELASALRDHALVTHIQPL